MPDFAGFRASSIMEGRRIFLQSDQPFNELRRGKSVQIQILEETPMREVPARRIFSRFSSLALLGLSAMGAAPILADEVKIIPPAAITYRADANVPGVSVALIDGNPKDGPYTVRAKISRNVKIPAHFHPDNRVVTVISGTYYFGAGDKYDEGSIKGYGPGTTIVVPAHTAHYAGSAEDGAIVQESGTGPTGITLTGK